MRDTVQEVALEIADTCLAVSTRRLARIVTAMFDEALRPHGVTTPQLIILVAVKSLGRARPSDLGAALAMEKSTVSRDVTRMVEKGWLKKTIGGDLRTHTLTLTSAGSRLLRLIYPAWRAAQMKAEASVGARATETLRAFGPTRRRPTQ